MEAQQMYMYMYIRILKAKFPFAAFITRSRGAVVVCCNVIEIEYY